MTSPLKSATIAAPGFYGLNTQESGITLNSGFALEATNCIIDKFGRIGSRKGWTKVNGTAFTGQVRAIAEYTKADGTLEILYAANNKLWRLEDNGTSTELTDTDGTNITITDDDWQIICFNNYAVFVQDGHEMVYYDGTGDTYAEYSSAPGSTSPSCGAACFNRMWVADGSTVYWSKILEPQSFSGTGTGYINVKEVFGEDDTVTAITSYNNRLVIFGRRNIAFFSGAEDPTGTGFYMTDHIKGIGCVARDSVQNVGTDAVFLSADGVRSVGRTIQEVSSPIGDISRNVRDEIVQYASGESEFRIKGVFSQENAFYLLTLPTTGYTYCFDMRGALQDGSRRVTRWTNINPTAYCVRKNQDLLLGQDGYVGKYDLYSDNTDTYRMLYYTNYFDFGSATTESLLKKIRLAVIGATSQDAALKWAFDYDTDYRSTSFTLSEGITSEYNVDEYFSDDDTDNEAEYSSGIVLDNISLNVGGRGAVVQIGIEADITGGALSLQKMDIFAKDGKLIS
jgi:hypothetical protein